MTTTQPDETSRRAARWLQSGLVDLEFYGALRGRRFEDAKTAAEDFVSVGMSERLSPHPFLDFISLPAEVRRAWRGGRVGVVLAHLSGDDGRARPAGPLADPADPEAAREDLLALAQELGRDIGGESERPVASVDWTAVRGRELQPALTSVIIVATEARRAIHTVRSLLDRSGDSEIEVIVVDNGSATPAALGLRAAFHGDARVELLRIQRATSFSVATNLAIARASGEVLILMDGQVIARRGWLPAVLQALDDPEVAGVQPVVLRADDTIDSAGLAVAVEGDAPRSLLQGHPKEDARRLTGERLEAIAGQVMALRTEDVVSLEGLRLDLPPTEAALDLCARLLQRRPAGFRIASTALVSLPKKPEPPEPESDPRSADAFVTPRRSDSADRLRWSLKLPSPPGHPGDLWGDTHFADSLATALRDLGQDVVTSRRGAHTAGPTHLDDVSLALRGLYPISPTPGQVNVLWVISHPDDVDPQEFEGYDLVCASSVGWSAELTARTGREIVPLLQASEFQPPAAALASDRDPRVVFVGSAHGGRDRPLVWKAVESGVPLAVYGHGWEGLPEGIWQGKYVDNSRLPEIYRRHGIVLADHWADMAHHGFIANRVFDAVASGARVICDDVAGLHDVFDPHDVVVARTPGDIVAAVAQLRAEPANSNPRTGLSFHDRARTLLDLLPRR